LIQGLYEYIQSSFGFIWIDSKFLWICSIFMSVRISNLHYWIDSSILSKSIQTWFSCFIL